MNYTTIIQKVQKTHLQGAQMMIASMYEGNDSSMTYHTVVTNNTG